MEARTGDFVRPCARIHQSTTGREELSGVRNVQGRWIMSKRRVKQTKPKRRTQKGPAASAGDVDADWQRAESSGEEAAGGSVSTPDQDRVDEIGHALGVEQPSQAPLRTSEEILGDRDQRYWDLERRASRKADKRREP